MSTRRFSHSATTGHHKINVENQLIVLKPMSKKVPDNVEILLENVPINPSSTAVYWEISTLAHLFTMAAHMGTVRKNTGTFYGMLRRCAA